MSIKMKSFLIKWILTVSLLFSAPGITAQEATEATIVQMLQQEQPYHTVNAGQFDLLGWDLPDGGAAVSAMANAAPLSTFDPRELEQLPSGQVGYRATWHEVRYSVYGLDWDIPGLHLLPDDPVPGMPTLVFINGGGSNWYEFFVDPLNRPGLGQYLAQKVPVLLVTIPGNYRHGGWTESNYANRIPGYLLNRDVSAEEARIRNAIYTFRVVSDGVKALVEKVTTGPIIMIGHSTGGEIQYLLSGTDLNKRMQGLSLGWSTGGPAGLENMQNFRGVLTADRFLDVWNLRSLDAKSLSGDYLGPLNPVWDPEKTRLAVAEHWNGLERRRQPHFKQPLQDMEHFSAANLRDYVAGQIRQTLEDNELGVEPEEVITDLFSTMNAPITGYKKMIWTVAAADTGHWDEDLSKARELLIANEFREKNPNTPIRVLLFDVPMTHYGHIEKPRQLAGGLLAALQWLVRPE